MTEYTIERFNDRPLRFEGTLVASVAMQHYHTPVLRLYRTTVGKLVCESAAPGARRFKDGAPSIVTVCETEADVICFFGHKTLARELYRNAKIEYVETIS